MSATNGRTVAQNLLQEATALGIPWERILGQEIRAERMLRLCISDVCADWPLWAAFWVLPVSLLNSWRVRDRIHVLAWEASRQGCERAARQLRALHAHFAGRQNGRRSDAAILAKHLWFGYQRVVALTRIGRLAARLRGDPYDRMESVRKMTGCTLQDARWAVERLTSPTRGHSVDDAMRRTRDEGFELPEDENEVRAFRRLRSLVRSSRHFARLQK